MLHSPAKDTLLWLTQMLYFLPCPPSLFRDSRKSPGLQLFEEENEEEEGKGGQESVAVLGKQAH